MKVEEAKYSILELRGWLTDRTLLVNHEYQRSGGLWPSSAKSYFIDSILRDFPFPKVYFYESLDRAARKPRREIVDGQQRVSTIIDFTDDKFALGKNAGEFKGLRFSQLPPEKQDEFWAYTVSVDVIRNADKSEILQMFRRMNAFTLPLNAAEKRHSEFFGSFKDWVNRTLDSYGSVFVEWKVFTSRQIVRMADAEFLTDLALAVREGIVSTSPKKLTDIYSLYDDADADLSSFDEKIWGALDVLRQELSGLRDTYAVKPHILHSLICALIHNKYGLPGVAEKTSIQTTGTWFTNAEEATMRIQELVVALETKNSQKYPEFVKAAAEGGNRAQQRLIRVQHLCMALQGDRTL